jgi:hypothetical protein
MSGPFGASLKAGKLPGPGRYQPERPHTKAPRAAIGHATRDVITGVCVPFACVCVCRVCECVCACVCCGGEPGSLVVVVCVCVGGGGAGGSLMGVEVRKGTLDWGVVVKCAVRGFVVAGSRSTMSLGLIDACQCVRPRRSKWTPCEKRLPKGTCPLGPEPTTSSCPCHPCRAVDAPRSV